VDLNEESSRPLYRQAFEAGINFFDTANIYSDGTSEEFLGRAVREFSRRDEVVIATKLNSPMRKDPNAAGLSRKAVMTEIDASLKRLGTDYVDLYQIHRFDYTTPIEETLEALHDVVKAGKARYIGASSMYAYQFCKALYLADLHGWTRFVSMQNHYNLLYREEEREMLRLCREEGVGVIPWSPLARGRLTRDFDETTFRTETDQYGKHLHKSLGDADRRGDRRRGPGRPGARRAARAGGPGLGGQPPRRDGAHHRRVQTGAPAAMRWPALAMQAHAGGGGQALESALHPACRGGLLRECPIIGL
jgi:aryl-alcohol dehydrogenase-like predicted oxidoreductase